MQRTAEVFDQTHRPAHGGWYGRRTSASRPRRVGAVHRPASAPTPVPLIGRVREMAELRTALDAALAGDGRLVLLGGEPGIGKTRLASALADEASARGVPVWWGRGLEDGSAPAFWTWSAAVPRWIGRVGSAAAAVAAGAAASELASVFPVLHDPPAGGAEAGDACEAEGARFRLFDAVSRFIAAVAAPAGLVVVLDDVHWADGPSLKLLEFVASDLSDARVLVVATYRDTEVGRGDALFGTLSRLAREIATRRLSLGGLTRAECARWVDLAGLSGEAGTLADTLHRETSGNPFVVGEIVHLLASGAERAAWDGQQVPQSVREVIVRRLDRLGPACRTALEVAALFGDTIDAAMLARVLGVPSQADHLERAARDRILAEGDAPGHYAFSHALIRRVLVDELRPSARAAWHERIAAVLERHAAANEALTTELVRHLAAAGTPESLRAAFEHACRGAEQAARGLGWEEAVRLYEIALDVGARSALLDARRAAELELALARALRGAGDVPAARARCTAVMDACRRAADPVGFARAALVFAGPLPEWGRVEPGVRAVLEEACKGGPALDDALRARLYGRLAGDIIAANEIDQEERVYALCDEAAAAARRAGDDGALAVALTGTYYAAAMGMRRAEPGRPVPSVTEILRAADAGGEHELGAAVRHARAMALLSFGALDAFSAEVDTLSTAAAAARVPEALWLADGLIALRATVHGRFAEAESAMARAHATARRVQLPNAHAVHVSQRIMWHAFRGRLGEITPEIEHFVAADPGGSGWRPFRALARLARGDVAAAREELETLVAAGFAFAERGSMARCSLAGLAMLCVALRDRTLAPRLYDALAERDDAWCVDGFHTLGPWSLPLGALARLCGRAEEAVRHFERAIDLGRRMASPPIVARAQSMLASVRLAMRPDAAERERIATTLAEAARCADELGLVDVAARVARLQKRLAHPPRDGASDEHVFRCEGDVWAVRFAGRELRIRDGKGPRYLATLLASPGRELHVLELASGAPVPAAPAVLAGLSPGGTGGSLDDAPDALARREYRARVEELRADLDEAEQLCDVGRAGRIRAELEFLVAQLAQTFGSRARTRGPAETARKAVTKVLRTQIGKLLEAHAPLGEHLRDSVRMGTFCSYAPRTEIDWEIAFAER